jgi:uncharacterized membrane protein YidH (DUF202 family)
MTGPPVLDDEGLFEERTQLAWSRSGIAVMVCVTVLLRRVWPLERSNHVLVVLLVATGLLVWVGGWALARRATVHSRRTEPDRHASTLRAVSVGTFVLALAGFVLGLFPPPA